MADDQHDLGQDFVIDPWMEKLWKQLLEKFPLPQGIDPLPSDVLPPPKYKINFTAELEVDNAAAEGSEGPFLATLVSNHRLTSEDHFQDTRLIELDIGENLTFNPGYVCLVQPRNSSRNVDKFLSLFSHMEHDKKFQILKNDENIDLPPSSVLQHPMKITTLRYFLKYTYILLFIHIKNTL